VEDARSSALARLREWKGKQGYQKKNGRMSEMLKGEKERGAQKFPHRATVAGSPAFKKRSGGTSSREESEKEMRSRCPNKGRPC